MVRKEKKYHFIYKTTNILSGKYYIGMHSTSNLDDGYMGSGKRLRYSINKHGKDNHKVVILEFVDTRDELKRREEEIVNLNEIAKVDCMNLKVGGFGGFSSDEHRKKFMEAVDYTASHEKIKWLRENDSKWVESLSNNIKAGHKKIGFDCRTFEGKSHSEETKKLISETAKDNGKGKNNSQYGTCWITNGIENKKIKKEDLETYIGDGWVRGRK